MVSGFLDEQGFRHALVGGLALAVYGLARTTVDLDLVVEARAQSNLVEYLEESGYETLHLSGGYSNHLHADPSRGRIDFIYVDPPTAETLFSAARSVPGPGDRAVLVPTPEHLAAMKGLAMKNDPSRRFQDSADVRFLLSLPETDRAWVRQFFVQNGMEDTFDEIARSL